MYAILKSKRPIHAMSSSISSISPPVYHPSSAGAGKLTGLRNWNVGSNAYEFSTMLNNIFRVLYSSILALTAAVFLSGAFLYIIGSFGKEDLKSNGKGMMIGSLLGMLIVLLARFIVYLTLYFMYGQSL